jgi:putative transposase
MKLKNKFNFKKQLRLVKYKIKKYSKNFTPPKLKLKDKITHSWFDVKYMKNKNKNKEKLKIHCEEIKSDGYYTEKIKLYTTKKQEEILLLWMKCYVLMYNETIRYFHKCRFNKVKIKFKLKDLYETLKTQKKRIIDFSCTKGCKVCSHSLNYAIKDALSRLRSCLTNLKRHNIKHFRLRYIKLSKQKKIIKFEKLAFEKNGFCINRLGSMKCCVDNFNYLNNIETVATVVYDKKFYLHLRKKVKRTINKNTNVISIDPGIRTYATCYSNDHVMKIGTNGYCKIKFILNKIDKIQKKEHIKCKQKKINQKFKRIKDMVTDFKWKTIKLLTDNYKTIVIGNLSTKAMVEKDTVSNTTKRIGSLYNLFDFKQKLQYKCYVKNVNYKEINEGCTSKCCCKCGNYKEDLGSNEIYKCDKCGLIVDRDVNGSLNILYLSLQ